MNKTSTLRMSYKGVGKIPLGKGRIW
jgi:hypothetical protein